MGFTATVACKVALIAAHKASHAPKCYKHYSNLINKMKRLRAIYPDIMR